MTWRPNGLRVGKMRERIDIQVAQELRDDYGNPDRKWVTLYASEPAEYTPTRGMESLRGKSMDATIQAVFIIHRRDNISATNRLVHNGTTYGIDYVHESDGGRRYLELFCKAVDNGAC